MKTQYQAWPNQKEQPCWGFWAMWHQLGLFWKRGIGRETWVQSHGQWGHAYVTYLIQLIAKWQQKTKDQKDSTIHPINQTRQLKLSRTSLLPYPTSWINQSKSFRQNAKSTNRLSSTVAFPVKTFIFSPWILTQTSNWYSAPILSPLQSFLSKHQLILLNYRSNQHLLRLKKKNPMTPLLLRSLQCPQNPYHFIKTCHNQIDHSVLPTLPSIISLIHPILTI